MNQNNNQQLNSKFVTGFADAESSFGVYLKENNKRKIGWQVRAIFQIHLHRKDQVLLEQIRSYFGVGRIYSHGKNSITYVVDTASDLEAIINHFEKYPLITQKRADYELFKQIVLMVLNKEHHTHEGIKKIVAIKASINLGLSAELKAAFPEAEPVQRPLVELPENIDPNWLAGFVEGEGCFYVSIFNSKASKTGTAVYLRFTITQHSRDLQLMNSLAAYFGCGHLRVDPKTPAVYFSVSSFSDIDEKVIPFFQKYPLQGAKVLNFQDFCRVALLMKDKSHLTAEGLEQIREIKAGMNTGRDNGSC
jgi:hypothetical protein